MSLVCFNTRLEATIAEVKSMGVAGFSLTAIDGSGERHIVINPTRVGEGEIVTLELRPGRWTSEGIWRIATD